LRKTGKVRGLFTALITPFDANGHVSVNAVADLARLQISSGVDGLYPCGSTGLGPMLGLGERKLIAEAVLDEATGRLPVVVQVGAPDTHSSIELAKHAAKHGAEAIASLTPYYYKPGDLAVQKHFEAIARSVAIPLFAYNIPQFTGNNLKPATIAALAKAGTIAGVKDSARDILQLLELLGLVPDGFVVMNGTEEYGLFAMMMGGDGLVSGGANAFPEIFVALVAALRAKDYQGAVDAQQRILQFKDAVKEAPIPSYYAILSGRGVDCGVPRAPFLPLGRESRARLKRGASKLGLPWSEKS
jgi:4-hydroxy-tetrahydrodipicolinate synthase